MLRFAPHPVLLEMTGSAPLRSDVDSIGILGLGILCLRLSRQARNPKERGGNKHQ
jgi:hypothetical protein